jgi:hypothetical protein
MRSMGLLQMAGGVVAAGVVAAGATAVTGSGVVWGGSNGGTATQFVGGTLTQTVSGATITDVVYTPNADPSGTQLASVAITVTGANTKWLQVTPGGGTLTAPADRWKCTGNVAGTILHASAPKVQLSADPATVTCVTAQISDSAAVGYYAGMSSLAMAITNS